MKRCAKVGERGIVPARSVLPYSSRTARLSFMTEVCAFRRSVWCLLHISQTSHRLPQTMTYARRAVQRSLTRKAQRCSATKSDMCWVRCVPVRPFPRCQAFWQTLRMTLSCGTRLVTCVQYAPARAYFPTGLRCARTNLASSCTDCMTTCLVALRCNRNSGETHRHPRSHAASHRTAYYSPLPSPIPLSVYAPHCTAGW